jgi:hypothetical protein
VKSPTKAIAPLWLSIRRCTRSALKRNKIVIREYPEVDHPEVGFEPQRSARRLG